MNILAFDTCFSVCSVALGRDDGAVFSRRKSIGRGHAEVLMPMIQDVMGEAGLSFEQLDRIAVTRGPGSFTGVRVGVSAARGLALAAGKPVVSTTSLYLLAASYFAEQGDTLLSFGEDVVLVSVVDARRDELYVQIFGSSLESLSEAQALRADQAAESLPRDVPIVAIGSGARALAEAAENLSVQVLGEGLEPDAVNLLSQAEKLAPMEEALVPLYLRPPDAKPQVGKSIERV